MKTNVTVEGMTALTPLELLDAHVSNRLPAHVTVRMLLELLHKKLKAEPKPQTIEAITIADRIWELYILHGKSWRKLGRLLETDHAYVHKVYKGSKEASDELLARIGLFKHIVYTRAFDHGE